MYKVGGSLDYNAPCYVKRKADDDLYQALKQGEFCYVLNSRQMGKSSLLVQTKHQLQRENFQCASLDLTKIGSDNIKPRQWYKAIITELWRTFNLLGKINYKQWYENRADHTNIQLLNAFITEVLFPSFPQQNILIFIDEIDSILALDFTTDDFFAFIRFCYNQRVIDQQYNYLSFAIFGVATPSDLIKDKTRTPFNIGKAIELHGFSTREIAPLTTGLNFKNSDLIIQKILNWTGGQPFLTQKICQIIVDTCQNYFDENLSILPVNEVFFVENIVKTKIIYKWQSQDEPEHLKTIRDRLLSHPEKIGRLLEIYQNILVNGSVETDNSHEQIELILSGLVINYQGNLIVKNKIYQEVFNSEWVQQQLYNLRPYSQFFQAWIDSQQQDSSRLLRGQALEEAKIWSAQKSLTVLDYQYLRASEECDRREKEQALEVARINEVEARLLEEQKTANLQRLVIKTISFALLFSLTLGAVAITQYRQAKLNEQQARISEIKALITSAEGQFSSGEKLDALIDAIKAKKRLKNIKNLDLNLGKKIDFYLSKTLYGAVEKNRLTDHQSIIYDIVFSEDNQFIFTISRDNNLKVWNRQGQLIRTIKNEENNSEFHSLAINQTNNLLWAGTSSGTVKILDINGNQKLTIKAHNLPILDLALPRSGQYFVTASEDKTAKLWRQDGTFITTLKGHQDHIKQVKISPDGKMIATASFDNTIKLWTPEGKLIKTLEGHQRGVYTIAFSPDSKSLVSGSSDQTMRLWNIEKGTNQIIGEHTGTIYDIIFSHDGQFIISVDWDKTVIISDQKGKRIDIFRDHNQPILIVNLSPDGSTLATGSYNGEVKLWQLDNHLLKRLHFHQREIWNLTFSPDSELLLAGTWDKTATIWRNNGQLLKILQNHGQAVTALAFTPDSQRVITGSLDRTIRFWNLQGEEIRNLPQEDSIWGLKFSPNGECLAAAINNKLLKLIKPDGTEIKQISDYPQGVYYLAFSPDGKMIASSSLDQTIRIKNLDGQLLKILEGHDKLIWWLDWSKDGSFIASSSPDRTVKLWFLETINGKLENTKTLTLKGHNDIVDKLSISPDSQLIASGSWDQTIKIWDRNGNLIKTLVGHSDNVRSIAFSPDGKWLASGDDSGTIMIWDIKKVLAINDIETACNWVRDYLHYSGDVAEDDRNLCD